MIIYEREKTIVLVSSDQEARSYDKGDIAVSVSKGERIVNLHDSSTLAVLINMKVDDNVVFFNKRGRKLRYSNLKKMERILAGFSERKIRHAVKEAPDGIIFTGSGGGGIRWNAAAGAPEVVIGNETGLLYSELNKPDVPAPVVKKDKDTAANTKAKHIHKNAAILDALIGKGKGKKFLADNATYKSLPEPKDYSAEIATLKKMIQALEKRVEQKADKEHTHDFPTPKRSKEATFSFDEKTGTLHIDRN